MKIEVKNKMLYRFKMAANWPNNRFLFRDRVVSILAKIWKKIKNILPKDFFNEIWLKVGDW